LCGNPQIVKFSSHYLWKSRSFWGAIAAFALANLWSWLRHHVNPVCCDQEQSIGFPFPIHVTGGIGGFESFYVFGLLLDVVVAWTAAVLLVWIVRVYRNFPN